MWDAFIDSVRAQDFSWDYWLVRLSQLAPSHVGDEEFSRRLAMLYFGSAPSVELWEIQRDVDIRGVLGSIQAPTLVVDRRDNLIQPVEVGDYLAERIPGARRLVVDGGRLRGLRRRPGPVAARGDRVHRQRTIEWAVEPGAHHRALHRHRRLDPLGA
jgi:pimeloyl-ACP methyl ester carboxylesterase